MTQNEINQNYLAIKRKLFDTYFSFLNPEQRKAVFQVKGPLLILAGAGSGKTTVLVNRLGFLLRYGNAYHSNNVPEGINESVLSDMEDKAALPRRELGDYLEFFKEKTPMPWQVMAITFTNKAAGEIKERIKLLFPEGAEEPDQIWSGTFHSVCLRILRRYISEIPYKPNFGICDSEDQKKLIKEVYKTLNISDKNLSLKDVLYEIGRAKDKLQDANAYAIEAGMDFKYKQIARIYEVYEKTLKEANLLDFDDIIMQTVLLLKNNSAVLEDLQHRFRYISIDEYQDTNQAQFELAFLLSGFHRNLMVVGDDDQSIYKFRGATITNILHFDSHYKEAKVIKLEQNYRSTKQILNAANAVIAHNTERRDKSLWTNNQDGAPVTVVYLDNQFEESKYIADKVQKMHRAGTPYRSFAVLYRMNSQSRNIEDTLLKKGIPYRMLCGTRFYERAEIKDMLAYLSVIANEEDTVHLQRIINTPRRGIGPKTIDALNSVCAMENQSALRICRNAKYYPLFSASNAEKLSAFAATIDSLYDASTEMPVSELIRMIVRTTNYEQHLRDTTDEPDDKIQNVEELISAAAQYEAGQESPTLAGFLEEVALVSDVDKYDETADAIVLMTVHSAKGLEFPVVFVPGLEENIFPSYLSMNDPSDIEEERRLAYVAITRAKDELILMHTHDRMINGSVQMNETSRFLEEIPDKFVFKEDLAVQNQFRSTSRHLYDDDFDADSYSFSPYFPKSGMRPEKRQVGPAKITTQRQPSPSLTYSYQPKQETTSFAIGDRVSHATFGHGTIVSIKPMSGDALLEVAFDDAGTKKLMKNYAKLKKD